MNETPILSIWQTGDELFDNAARGLGVVVLPHVKGTATKLKRLDKIPDKWTGPILGNWDEREMGWLSEPEDTTDIDEAVSLWMRGTAELKALGGHSGSNYGIFRQSGKNSWEVFQANVGHIPRLAGGACVPLKGEASESDDDRRSRTLDACSGILAMFQGHCLHNFISGMLWEGKGDQRFTAVDPERTWKTLGEPVMMARSDWGCSVGLTIWGPMQRSSWYADHEKAEVIDLLRQNAPHAVESHGDRDEMYALLSDLAGRML